MPLSGTGERVTRVLDFASRDAQSVQAIRVDDGGAYVYVGDGSGGFVLGDAERATVYDRV